MGTSTGKSASDQSADSLNQSVLDDISSVEGKLFVVDNTLNEEHKYPIDLQHLFDVDRIQIVHQQDKELKSDSTTDGDLLAVE